MNIPPEYEDVVAKLDAALSREAALREELATLRESYESMRDRKNSIVELQQRLTVEEQRSGEMEGLLSRCAAFTHDLLNPISLRRDISAALKPAEDYNELDDDEDLEVFDDQ